MTDVQAPEGVKLPTRSELVSGFTAPASLAALVKRAAKLPRVHYPELVNRWAKWEEGDYLDHTSEAAQAIAHEAKAVTGVTRRQATLALGFRAPRDFDIAVAAHERRAAKAQAEPTAEATA